MRLGIIVTEFPRITETFVMRDVLAFAAAGHEIRIYRLGPQRKSEFVHPFARPVMSWVRSKPFILDRAVATALLSQIRANPRGLARIVGRPREEPWTFKEVLLKLGLPIGAICGLILPANFSTAALLGLTCLVLLFIGQVPLKHIGSLVLVAIYPFMKRVTWWPQLFLGLAFSYGALVGWSSQTGSLGWAPVVLYLGTILWVIGYDTIYALQDIEDDALVGVKSTARLFGANVRPAVAALYAGAFVLWNIASLMAGGGVLFALLSLVAAGLLAWQLWTLDAELPRNPFIRFYNNHYVGMALTLALLAEWVW